MMAYKCLSLCGLFSFFKGFGENLFHAGFQFIQIEGRSLHGKTENDRQVLRVSKRPAARAERKAAAALRLIKIGTLIFSP